MRDESFIAEMSAHPVLRTALGLEALKPGERCKPLWCPEMVMWARSTLARMLHAQHSGRRNGTFSCAGQCHAMHTRKLWAPLLDVSPAGAGVVDVMLQHLMNWAKVDRSLGVSTAEVTEGRSRSAAGSLGGAVLSSLGNLAACFSGILVGGAAASVLSVLAKQEKADAREAKRTAARTATAQAAELKDIQSLAALVSVLYLVSYTT
mmetsp:Transcript_43220/g.107250  ORF Transcript_43220/g.107250 Transcript_43220/m.107250 type:complete len:206 (+) Transcript_43220:828-1445(+)